MNDVEVVTSSFSASNATTAHNKMLLTGVPKRACNVPKNDLGNTPSRPMAYNKREPLAWADSPEANWPTIRPIRKIDTNTSPPILRAISYAAESTLANSNDG